MKRILIKLAIVIILGISILGINMTTAAEEENPYKKDGLNVDQIIELYHTRVNGIFNSKLELLTQGDRGSGISNPPKTDNCEKNNYSTFCLAKEATEEFIRFQEALSEKQFDLEIEDTDDLFQLSSRAIVQNDKINRELDVAKKSLDVALQSYNELRIAYAMHLKFEETIKNLYTYNSILIELRREIEKIPGKFIDATTAQCK